MSSASIGRSDLLWVTNVPTPYRAPLWSALGEQHGLTVALLADTEPNRTWKVDLDLEKYSVISLNAHPLTQSGGSTIYAPSASLLGLISNHPRAIVMDGWESPAYLAARWWATHKGVPVIASYRSTLSTHRFASGPIPAMRRWFFNGADAVLTAGRASTEAVSLMGVPRSRIVEGFNTVDIERFVVGAAKSRKGSVPAVGHHFLYVGQFIVRKNVEMLIRAFAKMRNTDDTLSLVGSGPLESRLRSVTDELKLGQSVIFRGHLDGDDLVDAYASACTFVLPSTEEVWGLVVNEALAAGLHSVVSTSCGIMPSISEMPGVFPTRPEIEDMTAALETSRGKWHGYILDHPIQQHTPMALSSIILEILRDISKKNR